MSLSPQPEPEQHLTGWLLEQSTSKPYQQLTSHTCQQAKIESSMQHRLDIRKHEHNAQLLTLHSYFVTLHLDKATAAEDVVHVHLHRDAS